MWLSCKLRSVLTNYNGHRRGSPTPPSPRGARCIHHSKYALRLLCLRENADKPAASHTIARKNRTRAHATSRAMAPASLSPSLPLLASPGPSASTCCHLPASPLSLGSGSKALSLALAAAPAPAGRHDSRWRAGVSSFSFLPPFLTGKGESDAKKAEKLKEELLAAIAPLDRGAEATPEDKERVEQIVRQLEAVNRVKEPLKSDLLNGKWELLYTTSTSILQPQRPKFLRPFGKIYQAINADTLRAQNMETWPYFNQVTANLVPLNSKRVAVKFDYFKIFSLIPIKAPGSGKGELEITYLDEELRISRGDKGNLFILKMVDPTYRVPLSTE